MSINHLLHADDMAILSLSSNALKFISQNFIAINCTLNVNRRQKLTTDFFRLFELTILVVNISISRKTYHAFHILRSLITKL